MVRVDERLIHGQIVIKWIEEKNADRIVIIDDSTAADPIMEEILRMALPKDIILNIYGIKEGANFLKTNHLNDIVIVLVKKLWVAKKIYTEGVKINEINIGRIPSGVGKKMVYANVFVSDKDIDIINFFRTEKVPMAIQMVPDSTPTNVYELEF
jgi:mannose/fructose/N-acetylgalactosamine-specific phosphotransferase system component IIB